MRTVAFTTLGCKINQFESAAMIEKLEKNGYSIVPFTERADIYVVNTCTVTAKTDAESRQLIRRAGRLNPSAQIVVTGCYAQVAQEELKDLPGVALILGNGEKRGLETFLDRLTGQQQVFVADIRKDRQTESLALESFAEHTRAFLQIQNGCNDFCTYCIVPFARGASRSVPFDQVISGITSFAGKGYREVVLTGIHLGAYGHDLQPERNLLQVMESVEEGGLVPRLRLGSMEPLEITPPFIEFLASSALTCPHLHIPLQSGSTPVLARMGRKYTAEVFGDLIHRLADSVPDICLGADVIAGFPGETDEEFRAGYSLISALPLAYLHVFPFSARPGTAAATMSGQLPAKAVKERAHALRELSDSKKREYYNRYVGKQLPVLFVSEGRNGEMNGLSRNFLQVAVQGTSRLLNREVDVLITGWENGGATGKVVSEHQRG